MVKKLNNYTHKTYNFVHISQIPFDEIKKIDIAMCKEPTQTVQAFYKDQTTKPDVVMNGGMFVMSTGKTIYSLKDEDKNVTVDYKNLDGFGIIGDKTLAIGKINDNQQYRDFISAYPALIKDGKACDTSACKAIDYKARRSVVGWDKSNLYVITIESPGLKFDEMQKMMIGMGLTYAANLDGGGSTCKLVTGTKVTTQVYNRPVDNVFCVYLNKEQPKYLYRVQVGAFSNRANANNFLSTVKSKGYTSAFIVQQNGLYKVQTGAFSIKANATNLVSEMKSKGLDAFVVEAQR